MISGNRTHLSSYLTGLLSSGRAVFSRDEAVRDLESSPGAFLDAAERLQRRVHLVNVRQGFYVVGPAPISVMGRASALMVRRRPDAA